MHYGAVLTELCGSRTPAPCQKACIKAQTTDQSPCCFQLSKAVPSYCRTGIKFPSLPPFGGRVGHVFLHGEISEVVCHSIAGNCMA